jgi:hypothetical protein
MLCINAIDLTMFVARWSFRWKVSIECTSVGDVQDLCAAAYTEDGHLEVPCSLNQRKLKLIPLNVNRCTQWAPVLGIVASWVNVRTAAEHQRITVVKLPAGLICTEVVHINDGNTVVGCYEPWSIAFI